MLHFAGFEALDAEAHRRRYERAAWQSGGIWNCSVTTGPLEGDTGAFAVDASATGWQTRSHVHVFHLESLVSGLRAESVVRQIAYGFVAAGRVIAEGGFAGYCRHAWRFGLFFLFPFLAIGFGLVLMALIALAPWIFGFSPLHCLWSTPLAILLFGRFFLPLTDKQHVLHLFADWRLAVSMARLDDGATNDWLAASVESAGRALREEADEY